jgi:uncharacterized repeat protein (TIGR01451 family)
VANPYVSHTEDGGATWSLPLPIPSSQPDRKSLNGKFLVLEDGDPETHALLNIISEVPATFPPGPMTLLARRSSDLGRTWSEPTVIAEADPQRLVIPGVALTPDRRTVYVSWQTCTDSEGQATPCDVVGQIDHFRVMFSKSANGGEDWQEPAEVSRCSTCVDGKLPAPTGPIDGNPAGGGQVSLAAPAIAVTDDGTPEGVVGVAFYDHRDPLNLTGGGARRTTHYWLRHSHDGGATWEEQKIAGTFDRTTAPPTDPTPGTGSPAGWLGDYQGIAPIDGGFATSFVLARPNANANFALADPEACPIEPRTEGGSCTDLFYSSIAFPVADLSLIKTGPSGRVPTGRNMTYTLTVANNGPDEASEVTAIDQLPASVSFVSATPSQGSCGESAGIVTCALGQMANGATATVNIVVKPTLAGTITNTASVSAFEADPDEINNTDSVETSVCRITSRRSSIPCG